MAKKIYTKTGDAGNTGLIGGTKVPKTTCASKPMARLMN